MEAFLYDKISGSMKLTYMNKSDKKLMKKLALEMKPALLSLAKK